MALQDTDNLIVSRGGTNYRMPASQLKDYAGAKVQIASSAPASPEGGTLWWDTVSGRLYVWYTDVNTSQWVETSPQGVDETIFVKTAGSTMTGTLVVPNLNTTTLNSGPLSGTRNVIVNGGMSIDQRNVGVAQTITAADPLTYTVDRWYAYCTGANVTGQQVQGASVGRHRYRFTGAASVTKIGFAQRIEQANSVHLAGNTVTLGVDLANSLLTTVTWTAYYANTADTFGTLASPTRTQIATGTFTVNSTVTRYSTQISIPVGANTGIEIEFSVGAQTSGTWTIGDVQLELGTVATSFERRSYGTELALCQRYCWVFGKLNNSPFGSGYNTADSGAARVMSLLPVTMRTSPSFQSSAASGFKSVDKGHSSGVTGTSIAMAFSSPTTVTVDLTVGSGINGGEGCIVRTDSSSAYMTFDAEL